MTTHLMHQSERQPGMQGRQGNSIRQIAILLNTLPERTHRVLLGQLGSDDKTQIAKELTALGEIDAMEQYRVLKRMRDELQAETSRVEKVESEIQDEIQIGRARVSKKRSHAIYRSSESVAEVPLESLAEDMATPTSDDTQMGPLADTQRGTPFHSPFQTQTDVVSGQAAMQPSDEVLQSMFAQFHQTQAAGVLPMAAGQFATRMVGAKPNAFREDTARILPIRHEQGFRTGPAAEIPSEEPACHPEELAERIDQFLTRLPAPELCRALGMVTTKQAFLVLCGLPNETAETVLQMLPRRKSRKVRSDMRRMGQLQLSDIDAAKQVVAEIAIRLTAGPQSLAA